MATAYEGGTGGKYRRRPLRRASTTPYDRPPMAIRGLKSHPASEEKNGWLSKLVDPASRIISRSASRFFSSVFRKRLAAPPAAPEANYQSCQEVPAAVCTNTSPKVREEGDRDAETLIDNSSTLGAQQKTNSDANGICELELLLRQKTFTRVEFDRLTQLLHSRTIEPRTLHPADSYEPKGKANVSVQGNGIGSVRNGNIPSPANISEEEFASPAELAKEYMGSRPSKVPSSSLSLRNQLYREDALPNNISFGQKTSNVSITPRSAVCFSGNPEPPRNGYMTPRPLGRSAMHRMSRSPYFKATSTNNIMGGGSYRNGYAGASTSSQWTPTNFMQSDGKLVHKRGSSVMDSDLGSSGPIRRIRQKCNLMSPPKDIHPSNHGNLLPTPSTILAIDYKQESVISNQKPLCLDGPEYCTTGFQHAENADNKTPSGKFSPITPHSGEIEKKRLHQLDNFPSKLTTSMLHERALKSMEDIDSTKFFNLQGGVKLDAPSDSHVPDSGSSISLKQGRVENFFTSNSSVSGAKVMSEAIEIVSSITSATNAKAGSAEVPSIKKPAFQMTAPEDAFDLDDDDDCNTKDASDPLTTVNVKPEPMISERKTSISETAISAKSTPSSSQSVSFSSLLNKEAAVMKASDRLATREDTGFSFPVAPAPSFFSQPPPTPTMPSPVFDTSALQKEQITAPAVTPVFDISALQKEQITAHAVTPVFDTSALQKEQITAPAVTFVSDKSRASVLSATTTKISDPAGLKFNESNATTTSLLDGSNSINEGKGPKTEDILKLSVNAASACASTTASLSNGSLTSTSSALSDAPVAPFSNSSVTTILSTGTATTTTVSSSQFGSGASTDAHNSVPLGLDKSNSTGLEGSPVKSSHLTTSSAISPGTSAAFVNTGSGPSVFSSTSSSSALATSSLLSSTGSGMTNGIFGFGVPAQSSASSSSVLNSSSQSPVTSFGATAGPIFGSQAAQAGSGTSPFFQTTASQFGSSTSLPTYWLAGSSSSGSSSSQLGSTDSGAKPFGLTAVSTGVGSSSFASSSSSSVAASSVFGSSTSPSNGFSFGSSSQPSTLSIFGSSTGASFGQSAPAPSSQKSSTLPIFSSDTSLSSGFTFGQSAPTLSSQPSTPSIFGSGTSLSTGFPFGQSAPTSGFGASSEPAFFTSASTTTSSASPSHAPPAFGLPTPASGFGLGSPGNDQMNVEDSMADDTIRAAVPMVPTFGQPADPPATPSFGFGSPAVPSGGPFQFGSQQNPSAPLNPSLFQAGGSQNPSPFQTAGNLEFSGGSFSLGSGGGGDKSGRKIVRVNRNKLRKK